jgi:putative tryptophan/tyrosine transport system substrate-binding protein
MAAELVALNVDLIQALSPAAIRAARAATANIPIVAHDLENDPVARGFIASNTRPGGNVTGVFLDFPDFSKKWLEALKEAVPQATNVAVMWDPATGPSQLRAVEVAAATLRFTLTVLEIRLPSDFEPAFQSAVQKGAGALLMLSSPLIAGRTKLLGGLAVPSPGNHAVYRFRTRRWVDGLRTESACLRSSGRRYGGQNPVGG